MGKRRVKKHAVTKENMKILLESLKSIVSKFLGRSGDTEHNVCRFVILKVTQNPRFPEETCGNLVKCRMSGNK